MLELAHAVTGGVIAYKIGNPLISLPLAFLSHFVIDLLPHWNPHLSNEKKKLGHVKGTTLLIVFLDSFSGLILGLLLASKRLPDTGGVMLVIMGCFLGVLPDLVEAPYYFFGAKSKLLKHLIKFQTNHQNNVKIIPGLIFQAVYIIVLLGLVFF